jgi:hypothetical protein
MTYGGVAVLLHTLLTSALHGGNRSILRPVRFTPRGKSQRYLLDKRLVEPQSQYGRRGKEKYLLPCRESNSDSFTVHPAAYSLYRMSYIHKYSVSKQVPRQKRGLGK